MAYERNGNGGGTKKSTYKQPKQREVKYSTTSPKEGWNKIEPLENSSTGKPVISKTQKAKIRSEARRNNIGSSGAGRAYGSAVEVNGKWDVRERGTYSPVEKKTTTKPNNTSGKNIVDNRSRKDYGYAVHTGTRWDTIGRGSTTTYDQAFRRARIRNAMKSGGGGGGKRTKTTK